MNSYVRVPVTPAIYKFIYRNYGPADKFDLSGSRQNALRIALSNLSITAEMIPSPERLPGKHIYLDLGNSKELQKISHLADPWLRAGYFFQHEFNQAIGIYIGAQRDLARAHKLNETQWNARIGLEKFLEKYQIEEYEYSYESLRRHYNRVNRDQFEYFERKLSADLGFCPQGETLTMEAQKQQIFREFVPCHIWGGKQPRIAFSAFSRSAQRIVRKEIRIPKNLTIQSDKFDWIDTHFRIINGYLKRGYTLK